MDSITQGLLGATIAEAGFRSRLGGRAVAFGAICGVVPDFDLVAAIAGEWASLVHHRGISHSLIALTLVSPLFGWLGRRWGRGQGSWRDWTHLSFWALITHPLLDLFTSYGTQLFLPVTNHRYALDGVGIVDPAYTVPLLLAVLLGRFTRLSQGFRAGASSIALVVSSLYLALGCWQNSIAQAVATDQLSSSGFSPQRVRATPSVLTVFAFRIIARDSLGDMRVGYVSTLHDRPICFESLSPSRDPLVQRVLDTREGRIFQWFSGDTLHTTVEQKPDGSLVSLHDARYGSLLDPARSMWGASTLVGSDGVIPPLKRFQRQREMDIGAEMRALRALMDGEALPCVSGVVGSVATE